MTRFFTLCFGLLAAVSMHAAPAADLAAIVPLAESLITQAVRYEHGEGVAKMPRRALELYCAAARLGSSEAAYRLAWMYANARGIERDDRHAVALYQRAAAQGHEHAKRMLQVIHADDPVLPDCLAPPISALVARAELAAMERLEQADRARAAFAKAESAKAEQIARAQLGKAEAAQAELAKGERLAQAERGRGGAATAESAATAEKQSVSAAIEHWLAAWSRRDINAYLSAYAKDFAVPEGRSRRRWEQERRARIAGKSRIEVTISALEIRLSGNEAQARFLQDYRSDRFDETSRKTLTLSKAGDRWLIRREQSLE